jgi:Caspase domain
VKFSFFILALLMTLVSLPGGAQRFQKLPVRHMEPRHRGGHTGLGSRLIRWLGVVLGCLLIFPLTISGANADKRIALVIGNGTYKNAPKLLNPPNDAADVAAALVRSGFDVIFEKDLDQIGMQDASIRFAREARTADVALFYYSGHALQFAGANYLAPVDAILRDDADLKRMVRVDEILADLQQAKNLRILVLDSCRDNPFAEDLKRSIGRSRSAASGRGLAKMESPDGTIISYATQAGRTADDGSGRNSPYTSAFLKHIEEKDNITTVFQHIGANVYEDTKGLQVPELSLSFFGEFYLNGKNETPAAITLASPPVDPCAGAAEHWRNADAIGTLAAYKDHLLRFPSCTFAGQAQSQIATLSKSDAVAPASNPFDGTWVINELCEKRAPIWPADSFQFAGKIKDGVFSYQYGEEGTPHSGVYDGKIGPDGTAEINVKGLTGSAANDPLHRSEGTPYHFKIAVKLDGLAGKGAGVRVDTPRPCHSEWSRLSATMSFPSSAGSDEHEKAKEDINSGREKLHPDLKPAEAKRSKSAGKSAGIEPDRRDSEPSSGRQTTSGLSCTKMLGKCGAVCVANTGRPDCASTVCVSLQQACLSTGCWHGRAFSGCGLVRQ